MSFAVTLLWLEADLRFLSLTLVVCINLIFADDHVNIDHDKLISNNIKVDFRRLSIAFNDLDKKHLLLGIIWSPNIFPVYVSNGETVIDLLCKISNNCVFNVAT